MQIISHRGYWKAPEEKNSALAFERSFALGFGTETDFRNDQGNLIIAHDPPKSSYEHPGGILPAEICFRLLAQHDCQLPLAINIKADGLQESILALLQKYPIENYFLFDMSVPDAVRSLRAGLRCFTRHSDLEPEPAFYALAHGVWMDSFEKNWITVESIRGHLLAEKAVCLVSPELHSRDYLSYWGMLRESIDLLRHPRLMLCTDLPEDAVAFFN
jgi:hypothetical protein